MMVSLTRTLYRVSAAICAIITRATNISEDTLKGKEASMSGESVVGWPPSFCHQLGISLKNTQATSAGDTKKKTHRFGEFRTCKRHASKARRIKRRLKTFCKAFERTSENIKNDSVQVHSPYDICPSHADPFSSMLVLNENLIIEDEQVSCSEGVAEKKKKKEEDEEKIVEVELEAEERGEEKVEGIDDDDDDLELDFIKSARQKFPLMEEMQILYSICYPESKSVHGVESTKVNKVGFNDHHSVREFSRGDPSIFILPGHKAISRKPLKSCLKKHGFKSSLDQSEDSLYIISSDRELSILRQALKDAVEFDVIDEVAFEKHLYKYLDVSTRTFSKIYIGISAVQLQSLHGFFEDCVLASKLLEEAFKTGLGLANSYEVLRQEYLTMRPFNFNFALKLLTKVRRELAQTSVWFEQLSLAKEAAVYVIQSTDQTLEEYTWRTSKCAEKIDKVLQEYFKFFNQILVPVFDDLSQAEIHKMCGFDESRLADISAVSKAKDWTDMNLKYLQQGVDVLIWFGCTLDESLTCLHRCLLEEMAR